MDPAQAFARLDPHPHVLPVDAAAAALAAPAAHLRSRSSATGVAALGASSAAVPGGGGVDEAVQPLSAGSGRAAASSTARSFGGLRLGRR